MIGDGGEDTNGKHLNLGATDVPILVVCGVCNLEFKSSHFLNKHKAQEDHFIRKK